MTNIQITHFSSNCFQEFLESKQGENIQKVYIKGKNISFGTNCFIRNGTANTIYFYVDTESMKKDLYGAIIVTTIKSIEELQFEIQELKKKIEEGSFLPSGITYENNILKVGDGAIDGGLILNNVLAITPQKIGTEDYGTSYNLMLLKSGAEYYQKKEGVDPERPPEESFTWDSFVERIYLSYMNDTTEYHGTVDFETKTMLGGKVSFRVNSVYCNKNEDPSYQGEDLLYLVDYTPSNLDIPVQNIDIQNSNLFLVLRFIDSTSHLWDAPHEFKGSDMMLISGFMNKYFLRIKIDSLNDITSELFENNQTNGFNLLAVFLMGNNPQLYIGKNAFKDCNNCVVYMTEETFQGLRNQNRISLEDNLFYGNMRISSIYERRYRLDDAYIEIINDSIIERFNL